jgi:hypothetical protein
LGEYVTTERINALECSADVASHALMYHAQTKQQTLSQGRHPRGSGP